MKLFRIFAALLGVALATPTMAQVNAVPQVGLITSNLRQQTYSAVSIALVPAAAATDIFCISPGTSKSVYVKMISVGGSAGTAITTPVVILRRNTAVDTGGTAATGTALPVAGAMYSTNAASTATLTAYTANPTINDASPTYIRVAPAGLPLGAAGTAAPAQFFFGTYVEEFNQPLRLGAGTTQQMCVNLNGVTISSGSLVISMEWTEE